MPSRGCQCEALKMRVSIFKAGKLWVDSCGSQVKCIENVVVVDESKVMGLMWALYQNFIVKKEQILMVLGKLDGIVLYGSDSHSIIFEVCSE